MLVAISDMSWSISVCCRASSLGMLKVIELGWLGSVSLVSSSMDWLAVRVPVSYRSCMESPK